MIYPSLFSDNHKDKSIQRKIKKNKKINQELFSSISLLGYYALIFHISFLLKHLKSSN